MNKLQRFFHSIRGCRGPDIATSVGKGTFYRRFGSTPLELQTEVVLSKCKVCNCYFATASTGLGDTDFPLWMLPKDMQEFMKEN